MQKARREGRTQEVDVRSQVARSREGHPSFLSPAEVDSLFSDLGLVPSVEQPRMAWRDIAHGTQKEDKNRSGAKRAEEQNRRLQNGQVLFQGTVVEHALVPFLIHCGPEEDVLSQGRVLDPRLLERGVLRAGGRRQEREKRKVVNPKSDGEEVGMG